MAITKQEIYDYFYNNEMKKYDKDGTTLSNSNFKIFKCDVLDDIKDFSDLLDICESCDVNLGVTFDSIAWKYIKDIIPTNEEKMKIYNKCKLNVEDEYIELEGGIANLFKIEKIFGIVGLDVWFTIGEYEERCN